jgi:integrase
LPDGAYRVRYRGPDRKERSKQFTLKRDADAWLTEQKARMAAGTWTDPALARITVAAWSARWLDGQAHLKPSTRARYAGLLRTHVIPVWGTVPLSAVTHADVASWAAGLTAAGSAPSTVRQAHRVLALMLGLAVRDGRLARNVADGIPLPRARRAEPRFLTREEVERLATAAEGESDVIRFLALTGLRFGEAAAMRVGRVNLLRRRVEVVEAVAEVNGLLEWGTPKTHQRRSVPLADSLQEPLAARCAGKGPNDLLLTAPRGGPLRLRAFRVRFDAAARAAGLVDLSPHDLRHTAASLAVATGASVKAVQRMLGHASAAMTLDVYSGLFEDDLDVLADRLDGTMIHKDAGFLRTEGVVVPMPQRLTAT